MAFIDHLMEFRIGAKGKITFPGEWLAIVFDRGKHDQWYALVLNFNQEFRE
jgi:hypothetical protein